MIAAAMEQPAPVRNHVDPVVIALGREPMDETIGVEEAPLPELQAVDVHRIGDRLVLMINGRPYALRREVAIELAFSICSHVETMDRV